MRKRDEANERYIAVRGEETFVNTRSDVIPRDILLLLFSFDEFCFRNANSSVKDFTDKCDYSLF